MPLILWTIALAPFVVVGVAYWNVWRKRKARLAQFPSSVRNLTASQRLRLWFDRYWPLIAVIGMWLLYTWSVSDRP